MHLTRPALAFQGQPDFNAMHFVLLAHIINASMQSLSALQTVAYKSSNFLARVIALPPRPAVAVLTTVLCFDNRQNKRTTPFLSLWTARVSPDLLQWALYRSMCASRSLYVSQRCRQNFYCEFFPFASQTSENYMDTKRNGKTLLMGRGHLLLNEKSFSVSFFMCYSFMLLYVKCQK